MIRRTIGKLAAKLFSKPAQAKAHLTPHVEVRGTQGGPDAASLKFRVTFTMHDMIVLAEKHGEDALVVDVVCTEMVDAGMMGEA
jgi:hypothetical protein